MLCIEGTGRELDGNILHTGLEATLLVFTAVSCCEETGVLTIDCSSATRT